MASTVAPSAAVSPLASASVVDTASTTPADPCLPLAEGEVSNDETPSIAGTTARGKVGDWLEARGISRDAFRAWVRSRGLNDNDADTLFDDDEGCATLKVGDKSEDALVCPLVPRTLLMLESAAVFVVRNKRIISVLEVGYALPALAWPDRRLDLQLTFAPGGLEADLHDRAKPGAVLVGSPSRCHEHYARYLACEKAHREGVETETVCPEFPAGEAGHLTPAPGPRDPIALFGCAVALPKIAKFVQENAGDPKSAYTMEEVRDVRAFVIKSCAARGHYTWKAGRFVRSSP
jgi:hypothetical protein